MINTTWNILTYYLTRESVVLIDYEYKNAIGIIILTACRRYWERKYRFHFFLNFNSLSFISFSSFGCGEGDYKYCQNTVVYNKWGYFICIQIILCIHQQFLSIQPYSFSSLPLLPRPPSATNWNIKQGSSFGILGMCLRIRIWRVSSCCVRYMYHANQYLEFTKKNIR